MSVVKVQPGVCGLASTIRARLNADELVELTIESECGKIMKSAQSLQPVDAYAELFAPASQSALCAQLSQGLHATCPVCCAALKAVEVAAGLALPRDVHIEIEA